MADQDASCPPTRDPSLRTGPLSLVKKAAQKGQNKVLTSLRSGLDLASDRLRHKLVDTLADPQAIARLQHQLARLADFSLRAGFRADPNAALLFRFVDWLEPRHGRQQITLILLQSSLLRDPTFLDALAYLSQLLLPWQLDREQGWTQAQLQSFKSRASDNLLELLVALAALERDDPPLDHSPQARIAYFQASPIPTPFHRLAPMAVGEQLLPRDDPRPLRWAERLRRRGASSREHASALTRFIPGTGDETLQFLVLSTTFFLQSYLLRHLVESLPEIAEEFARHARQDSTIDLTR